MRIQYVSPKYQNSIFIMNIIIHYILLYYIHESIYNLISFKKKKTKILERYFHQTSLSLSSEKKKRINHPPSRSRKRQIHPCNICSSEPNGTDLSSNPPNSISPSSANSPKRQYHNFLQPSGADLITPPPINRKPDLIVPVIEKAKTVVKRTMSQSKIRFTQWENGEVIQRLGAYLNGSGRKHLVYSAKQLAPGHTHNGRSSSTTLYFL